MSISLSRCTAYACLVVTSTILISCGGTIVSKESRPTIEKDPSPTAKTGAASLEPKPGEDQPHQGTTIPEATRKEIYLAYNPALAAAMKDPEWIAAEKQRQANVGKAKTVGELSALDRPWRKIQDKVDERYISERVLDKYGISKEQLTAILNEGITKQWRKGQAGAGPTEGVTSAAKATRPRPKSRPDVDIEPSPLTLKKGEKKKWPITIKRSGDYDKEFSIMLTSDDPGIKIPEEVKVPGSKDGKQTIEVEVSAGLDAKGGDITLIGTPPGIEDAKAAKVKVMVDK